MCIHKKIQRIKELKKQIDSLRKNDLEKTEIINTLEKFIEVYERVSEMSRQELIQANETLKAKDIVSEMTRQELINKDKIIQAQQSILEFSGDKKKEGESIIKAWHAVTDLARTERLEAQEVINALERIEELNIEEKKQKDQTIKAMELAMNFSRDEKLTYQNIEHAYRKIQVLSDVEKLHILELLNKRIRFDYEYLKKNYETPGEEAEKIAKISSGSIGRAIELASHPDYLQKRDIFINILAKKNRFDQNYSVSPKCTKIIF